MRVASCPCLLSVGLTFLSWRKTRAEAGGHSRRPTEHVFEVLRVNDEGRPTVVAGDLGEVGMDSTHANDEIFRDNVKQQLTSLLQFQMGGELTMAEASKRDLEALGSRLSKNGFSHIRFIQRVNGYPVEGASLMAHTDADGKIFLVNGEFLDRNPVPTKPILDSQTAISLAMKEAGISKASLRVQKNQRGTQDAELAMVRDKHDNVCFAWKILLDYIEVNKDDTRRQMKALLYANTQNGRLCGLHPQIFDLDPILRTYECTPNSFIGKLASISNMDCNYLYSDSLIKINTGQSALDAAHNNALATYQYYKDYHGLESFDDRNMAVKSYVLSPDFKYENAYWDRGAVIFGDGNPGSTNPYSFAIDVAAHEFTHGVIIHSSNLMYSQESGAIHEALCDIFGIQVKRLAGGEVSAEPSLWYIADKITVNGQGLRDMADPASRGHADYYPTRYQGGSPDDNRGGIHWNSGIANLAFYLFVNGGSHPRGKTSVVVKGLIEILGGNEDEAFEAAGDIFFCTAWSCLTSQSSFADIRLCTTTVCGSTGRIQDDEIISSMKDAWDAVGVLESSIPAVVATPSVTPHHPPTFAPTAGPVAPTAPTAPTFAFPTAPTAAVAPAITATLPTAPVTVPTPTYAYPTAPTGTVGAVPTWPAPTFTFPIDG